MKSKIQKTQQNKMGANHQEHVSPLASPPRTLGLSRRLIWVGLFGLFLLIMLFLYFLHRYTPQPMAPVASTEMSTLGRQSQDDDTLSMINKIAKTSHTPLVTHAVPIRAQRTMIATHEQTDVDPVFQEGGNAAISAYQAPETSSSLTTSLPNTLSSAHTVAESTSGIALDSYNAQNMQAQKTAFLKSSQQASRSMITSLLQAPHSHYELKAGTIIPATLVTGINSDLPGQMIAKVRQDVFDTVTGNYCLIPQGSTLIGEYSSQIAYGQSRVLIAWSRLIFPDGSSFNLQGMPGVDLQGLAGLHDQVNNHYFKIFGSTLMMSVFGALGQLSQPQNNSSQLTSQQIIYGAVGQQMSQTAMQMVAKNMDIQPTIQIRPGANFNVLLTRDMVLPHPYYFNGPST